MTIGMKTNMKHIFSLSFLLCLSCFPIYSSSLPVLSDYQKGKQFVHDKLGLDYQVRIGLLYQNVAPNGKHTAFRDKYEFEFNWALFESEQYGSGSVQFFYEDINYPHLQASAIAPRAGILESINDDVNERRFFKRLAYTHQLPGNLDAFSVSLGQYRIDTFGKITPDKIPFTYFTNFALSSNATRGYPTGGLGGYVTYQPSSDLTVITGLQDTTNYSPYNISAKHISDNRWTSFLYASKGIPLTEKGKTVITGWIYHSPSVPRPMGQLSTPLEMSNGWLINIRQDINKWTFFGKWSGSTGNRMALKQSNVLNILYHDPFTRNRLDQIGLGFAANQPSASKHPIRSWEYVAELYWAWGLDDFLVITPGIQFYLHPALTTSHNTATVSSLEFKFIF